jgi:hypothetical protein
VHHRKDWLLSDCPYSHLPPVEKKINVNKSPLGKRKKHHEFSETESMSQGREVSKSLKGTAISSSKVTWSSLTQELRPVRTKRTPHR